MRSMRYFSWISWGYPWSTDMLWKHQFCCFLTSFLFRYLFSKWNTYFLWFSLFVCSSFLSLSFSVFYVPYFSSAILCISSTFSLSFCLFLCLLYFPYLSFLCLVCGSFLYIYIYIFFNESMDIYKWNRNLESSWIYHNNIVKLGRPLKGDCVNSTRFKILQW